MGVVSRARTAGLGINIQDVLRSKSVVHLAQLAKSLASATTESRSEEETDEPFALSPIQSMYLHLAAGHTGIARFNQSNVFGVPRRLTVETLKGAIDSIVQRHPMLRARFTNNEYGSWEQRIAKVSDFSHCCRRFACMF